MMYKITTTKLILIFLFVINTDALSQIVFEPVENDIYFFLIRQNNKGNISFNETIQPLSRLNIANLLSELNRKRNKLSPVENKELTYFFKEYGLETSFVNHDISRKKDLKWFNCDNYSRLRFFYSYDKNFDMVVDPLVNISYSKKENYKKLIRAWGFNTYGYFNKNIGFQLNFTDNTENGDLINPEKIFSEERGVNIRGGSSNEINYYFLNSGVTYNWSWGYISFQKNYSLIGSGYESRIILSDKAPSFTKLELDVKFTNWLRLHYFHGFLHSDLMDSTTYRNILGKNGPTYDRRKKYYVFHMLSITPNRNWMINLGESIIYSDNLEPIYFIPVMFFRLADSFNQRSGSDTGDNAQIFLDFNYKNYYLKTKFYTTLFIDELSVGAIMGDKNGPSAIAYTLGFQTTDFPLSNSLMTIEYSRLNPFVYMNGNDAQTYTSHSYPLGYWSGSNADIWSIDFSHKFTKWIGLKFYYSYLRKGEKEAPDAQYELPYPGFLDRTHNSFTKFVATIKLSFINALGIQLNYQYVHENINISSSEQQYKKSGFSISMNYGLF